MLKTLLDKPAQWLAGNGPDAEIVLGCRGTLARNLADVPFPVRSSDEEKRSVEERVLAIIEATPSLPNGEYCSVSSMSVRDSRLLIERSLITHHLVENHGARGVYISEDQASSIMINERDHLRFVASLSGLQLDQIWPRLSKMDDHFASGLDYAFNERYGYLTSSLDEVGTGLRLAVLLHLPGLTAAGRILPLEKTVREKHHALEGLFAPISAASGDFYALSNRATLGRSEEEIVFHLRALAADLIAQERAARDRMLAENENGVLDRLGRALGVARGARLLDFNEGLDILSSIRLGVATQRLEGYPIRVINEVLIGSQPAHVARRVGDSPDQVARSVARAEMFRKRFGKDS